MNAPKIATSFPPAIENHIAKAALSVTGGRTPDVFHPVSCGFPHAGLWSRAGADDAVTAAHQAFPAWADPPPICHARILNPFVARQKSIMQRWPDSSPKGAESSGRQSHECQHVIGDASARPFMWHNGTRLLASARRSVLHHDAR
jgi:hypothetical protein